VVQADPEAISQAVLNLLNNAVKYSREHKRVAICVARHRQGGQSGVTIAVSDRGIGIPPDDRARVFDSFFRGSHEVVRSTRGSGLGLTLVQHIVAGHNGEVWVDSTLGQGSTFTIYLPGSDDRDSRKSGPQARHPIRSAEIDYRVCGPDLPEGNRPSPGVQ
jgi:signal transduction histidine kinase